ncbi:hypothetical protein QBC43DRAFT_67836 [Cladorrhinum sp. PSN259]|nr:hypothetical protein QBC43DRAFT_67836 [Cladorrhinum sp. PSN259]
MAHIKAEPEVEVSSGEQPQQLASQSYLQRLVTESLPDRLEQGTKIGVKVLESLKVTLEEFLPNGTTQAAEWLKSIADVEALAEPTRTIVGVVGNTGAGKSSVISAVLDEERLLPTNCMRACTASPSEISYNYSDKPDELYRGEVEFITTQDWIKDLQGLYTDFLDGNGEVSRDCSNQDTDAGVAYAKIKAVYPKKSKEMIVSSTPESLAREVQHVLGSTKKLKATTAAGIYRHLQEYVDSKEKNTEKRMEYWPLIKVVRIYTKAAALVTGAVLVDLPGVQDSNAARAAVAENYMKACTGLWIVAPITRAVDDKTAKSLLGDSFRRQLKFDGTYSAVTFICSKTDDISVTEAAESLNLEEEISDAWKRIEELRGRIRGIKKQLADLKSEQDTTDELIDKNDTAWDQWEALINRFWNGETVYAPKFPTKKRKRQSNPKGSRKNRVSSDLDDDDDISDFDSLSDYNDKENDDAEETREPLTEDQIEAKLGALKTEKRDLRVRRKEIVVAGTQLRKEIKELTQEKDECHAEAKSICIQGRNEYSREAIKHDFAMGIRELDQEAAAEQDEENFDPEVDLRDYDAVAKTLPVFCVSSRAFQKLSGRLEKDNFNSSGFMSIEDTEIPALQAHAKKLTEAGRAASARRFLNSLTQLLNSMTIWATNDGTRSNLTDAEKGAEDTRLRQRLNKIEQELQEALENCVASMKKTLHQCIYENFDRYIPVAAQLAVPTARGWGAHRNDGGMLWATYKAVCRRHGFWSGSTSGPRDLNAHLFEPIQRQLATGWERAFARGLHSDLDAFTRKLKATLETFHLDAIQRSQARQDNWRGLQILADQLNVHFQRIADLKGVATAQWQERQRDANRGFTPVIQEEMMPAYTGCVAESGPGSYKRMKDIMVEHVNTHKQSMFVNATTSVRRQLDQMCDAVRETLDASIQDIHNRLAADYLPVLVGINAAQIKGLPRMERLARAEMIRVLPESDKYFGVLFGQPGPHFEDEKAEEEMEGADETNMLVLFGQPGPHFEEEKAEEEVEGVAGSVEQQAGDHAGYFQDQPCADETNLAVDEEGQEQAVTLEHESDADEGGDDRPQTDTIHALDNKDFVEGDPSVSEDDVAATVKPEPPE